MTYDEASEADSTQMYEVRRSFCGRMISDERRGLWKLFGVFGSFFFVDSTKADNSIFI